MGLDPRSWDEDVFEAARGWAPRPIASGNGGGVSAQHALTAQAGLEVLHAGGSAADAIVAMVAVDCVVQPGTCSLAGCLGGLYTVGNDVTTLNAGMDRPLHH